MSEVITKTCKGYCPHCGSGNREKHQSEWDGSELWIEYICDNCEECYKEYYSLSYLKTEGVVY